MTNSKFNYTFGSVLILVGITVPSLTLIKVLRGEPPIDIRQQLIVGGTIFKIGLIIFGGLFLVRGRFSFFKLRKRPIESLPDSNRKVTIVILATILFAAFVLRIYGLNNGLWFDEIMTYVDFANTPFGEIITTFHSQNNHMLYSLLTHGSPIIISGLVKMREDIPGYFSGQYFQAGFLFEVSAKVNHESGCFMLSQLALVSIPT